MFKKTKQNKTLSQMKPNTSNSSDEMRMADEE